ncbi:MAG: putative GTP-binding protein YjiA [Methanomassiliicoccales archaeon PtaU1.Bin124]|nr:MAG: putative GTP-binding protein YjiA [Methanomassiliicoccales archaeon PtaU1.Bin124]
MPCGMTPATSKRTRFVILGGYLGAGKTTLAAALAKQLRDVHGRSVAVITNDQGDALVDTAYMKNAGVDVREVLGGCFCSHFDEFVKSARSLVNMVRPDIIIAEPIGTSTNVLASVVAPLREMYPDEFEVAPLFVVLDLSRVDETLKKASSFGLGGGRIIPSHQVHEAEMVLLTKADLVNEAAIQGAVARLAQEVPDAKVLPVSARTGTNIEALAQFVSSGATSSKAALGVDNRMFATEKATMGWYSGTAEVECGDRGDAYAICRNILDKVGTAYGGDNIGHVKLVFESEAASLKMSLVADSAQVDGIKGGRYAKGKGKMVMNARIMAPPTEIRKTMEKALRNVCDGMGMTITSYRDSVLRPVPEVPDHFRTK